MKLLSTFRSFCLLLAISLLIFGSSAFAVPANELELNDTNATTNPLTEGEYGQGVIASGAEYDGWIIQSVHSTDLIFALLSAVTDDGDPVLSGYFTKSIDTTATRICTTTMVVQNHLHFLIHFLLENLLRELGVCF